MNCFLCTKLKVADQRIRFTPSGNKDSAFYVNSNCAESATKPDTHFNARHKMRFVFVQ